MTAHQSVVEAGQRANAVDVDLHGPRLRFGGSKWIGARDRVRGFTRVDGCGAMGIGEVWRPDDGNTSGYPGYRDAPERSAASEWEAQYFARRLIGWLCA